MIPSDQSATASRTSILRVLRLLGMAAMGGCCTLVLAAGLQLSADPYGFSPGSGVAGVNLQKPFFCENSRLAKPQILARQKPEAVILGSSTSEGGYDPDHAVFAEYAGTYNGSVGAAVLYEKFRHFQHAVASGNVRLAVVGIDYLKWLEESQQVQRGFHEELLSVTVGMQPQFKDSGPPLSELLYWRRLNNGLLTLHFQDVNYLRDGRTSRRFPVHWCRRNGARTRTSTYRYGLAWERFDQPFRLVLSRKQALLREAVARDNLYPLTPLGEDNFSLLERFVELAARYDVRLIFNLPPTHVSLLEAYRAAGLSDEVNRFKRRVAETVWQAGRTHGTDCPVFDFSVYADVTASLVFTREDQTVPVTGFWDPAHFAFETGDTALDIMLAGQAPIDGFGGELVSLLKQQKLTEFFQQQQEQRRQLVRIQPREFAAVATLLSATTVDGERL